MPSSGRIASIVHLKPVIWQPCSILPETSGVAPKHSRQRSLAHAYQPVERAEQSLQSDQTHDLRAQELRLFLPENQALPSPDNCDQPKTPLASLLSGS